MYKDCGISFRLGTNLFWVEIHLTDILDENIEVGTFSEFIKDDLVEIYKPQGYFEEYTGNQLENDVLIAKNMKVEAKLATVNEEFADESPSKLSNLQKDRKRRRTQN